MLKVEQPIDYLKEEKVKNLAEKLAQLKRFKRADEQIKQIYVSGDGSCLFWSVALAYLAPVKDNDAEFWQRYVTLFGDEQNLDHVRVLIQNNYNPLSGRVPNDGILTDLVTSRFRNQVVNFMESKPNDFNDNQFPDYDGSDTSFQDPFDGMRNSNTWEGSSEILAMSRMLNIGISVTSGGTTQLFNDQNGTQIRLFDVSTISVGTRNHYNFGLEQSVIDTFPRTGSRPETPRMTEGSNTGQEESMQIRGKKNETRTNRIITH